MAVLVFQVYFCTVLVVEKKTKFSTKRPRKYATFTPKISKKISGEGALPPQKFEEGNTPSPHPTPLAPSALDLGPPTSTPRSAYVHTVVRSIIVRSHKLGLCEMENDCNLHDHIVLAIFWQKLSTLVET